MSKTVTSTYTMEPYDTAIIVEGTNAAITVTLPNPLDCIGKVYSVAKSHNLALDDDASETYTLTIAGTGLTSVVLGLVI